MLHHLIGNDQGTIAWWQMCVRALIVFAFGLAIIRLFGRRAFGKYTALDIVLAIVIGSNLSRTLTANAPFVPTLAATALLVLCFWIVDQLAARAPRLGRIVKGSAVPLIVEGKLDRGRMLREGISEDDIAEAARQSGAPGIDTVRSAYLERNGDISTVIRDDARDRAEA